MILMWSLWSLLAVAAEHQVVRDGDTVESIAAGLGDPALAAPIRALNGLAPGAQPPVGAVLHLPGSEGGQESLVLAVRGTGTVTLPGQAAVALAPQQHLPEGTQVCTDAESFATLRMARDVSGYAHDDISLLPSTCMTVVGSSARAGRRSSLVNMTGGSVSVQGTSDAPGSVIVVTPAGTTAGEQGGFRVTMEQGGTRAEAVTAPVSVIGAGQQVELDARQGTRIRDGAAPDAPRALIAGAELFTPEDGAPLRWPEFRWQTVPRALGYRLQIATSPDFSEVVHSVDVPFAEWQPDFLMLPFRVEGYWWRVSPLDRFGFEGVPGASRRLVVPAGVGP